MVEFMNFLNDQRSFFNSIRGKFFCSLIGFHKFKNNFTVSFFILQIRENALQYFFQRLSNTNPLKFDSSIRILFYVHVGKDNILTLFKSISNRIGGDDPCELRQTAGYRFGYATRITNDAWIINLRATLA